MFGFLNVFLAALFARERSRRCRGTRALLEERDASSLAFGPAGVTWRGRTRHGGVDWRAARAATATSFGSCSFEEPVADLSSLGLP